MLDFLNCPSESSVLFELEQHIYFRLFNCWCNDVLFLIFAQTPRRNVESPEIQLLLVNIL